MRDLEVKKDLCYTWDEIETLINNGVICLKSEDESHCFTFIPTRMGSISNFEISLEDFSNDDYSCIASYISYEDNKAIVEFEESAEYTDDMYKFIGFCKRVVEAINTVYLPLFM